MKALLRASLLTGTALALLGCGGSSSGSGSSSSSSAASSGSSGGGDGGGGGADPGDPLTFDVTKPGSYTCGHRELSTTYTPPGGIPSRTIPVHVWYPSHSTDGPQTIYHAVFPDSLAHDDVPLAKTDWKSGMPVLVHSHGHEGFAGNSARLMCHFASHGWLAVAPEHVGNTISDTPPVRPLALYVERPLDVTKSLDLVAALPKDDELSGKADMGHVAMSGHSFGSYTAWVVGGGSLDPAAFAASCQSGDIADCSDDLKAVLATDLSEKRAQVIIPMAGDADGYVHDAGFDAAKVPVLMMSGSLNPVGDDVIFAGSKKLDLTWVDVEGGCHQLFGLGNTEYGDASCAALSDEDGFALVNPWVVAYARYHVLADRSAQVKGLVEGTTSISPKVDFEHEGP